jgi:hypothetical protein
MATLEININQVGANFKAIRDKITDKGVEITEGTPTQDYANKIDMVYDNGYAKSEEDIAYLNERLENTLYSIDTGGKSQYDAFWDKFQNNGKRTAYTACFGGDQWSNGLLNPKYDIYITSAMYTFYYSTLNVDFVKYFEDIGKVFSFEDETARDRNLNSTFQYSQFTRVGKIYSAGVNWYSTFYGCTKLVTIDEVGHPDEDGNVQFNTSTFNTCSALENITIRGKIAGSTSLQWSTKLTEASIRSIITHLSDTASGKTLTLSKTAVNNAFTNEQWNELVNSKTNWTISLV